MICSSMCSGSFLVPLLLILCSNFRISLSSQASDYIYSEHSEFFRRCIFMFVSSNPHAFGDAVYRPFGCDPSSYCEMTYDRIDFWQPTTEQSFFFSSQFKEYKVQGLFLTYQKDQLESDYDHAKRRPDVNMIMSDTEVNRPSRTSGGWYSMQFGIPRKFRQQSTAKESGVFFYLTYWRGLRDEHLFDSRKRIKIHSFILLNSQRLAVTLLNPSDNELFKVCFHCNGNHFTICPLHDLSEYIEGIDNLVFWEDVEYRADGYGKNCGGEAVDIYLDSFKLQDWVPYWNGGQYKRTHDDKNPLHKYVSKNSLTSTTTTTTTTTSTTTTTTTTTTLAPLPDDFEETCFCDEFSLNSVSISASKSSKTISCFC